MPWEGRQVGRSPGESDTGRAAGGSKEDVKGLGSSGFLVWDQWEIYQPLKSQRHILQQRLGAHKCFYTFRGPEGGPKAPKERQCYADDKG